jgi:hypothetical protein
MDQMNAYTDEKFDAELAARRFFAANEEASECSEQASKP